MSKIDSITLGVIWGGLRSITEEMGAALKKTAHSLAVREAYDFSVGLLDDKGLLVAQGEFSPGHLGAMPFSGKHVLSKFSAQEMKAGDIVFMNDAYVGSGAFAGFFLYDAYFL